MIQFTAGATRLLLVAVLLSGCGHRDITSDQKMKFKNALAGLSRIPLAVAAAAQNSREAGDHRTVSWLSRLGLTIPNQEFRKTDAKLRSLTNALLAAKRLGCVITADQPKGVGLDPGVIPQTQTIRLSVTGAPCPATMALELKVKTNPQKTSANIDVNWNYVVSDPNFRPLNDIDQIGISGVVSVTRGQTETDQRDEISSQLKGEATSPTEGKINFHNSLTVDNYHATARIDERTEYKVGLSFGRTNLQLVSLFKNNNSGRSQLYTINGRDLSADEFQDLVGGNATLIGLN